MAATQTTATSLLALTKQRAYMPVEGGPSNASILRDLNAELLTFVAPLLMSIGEEFFVALDSFSTTSGTAEYDIPTDSIGYKIRDVQVYITGSGTPAWVSLAHQEPERAAQYAQTATWPSAYFIQANQIVILPTPQTAWSMRIKYYKRPREIVEDGYANATVASGPSGGNYTVTVDATDMATGDFDILDPDTYAIISANLPGTRTNATTLTFAAADLDSDQIAALLASVGDTYIASGTAPVADVPPEAAVLLALRAAVVYMQENDSPNAPRVFTEIERVKMVLAKLFAPRASGNARKVVNRWGPGWGSARWGRYTFGGGN